MKVVHISVTPLAGSPIRIVRALNAYTGIKARAINLDPSAYGTRTFPEDLSWEKDRAESESLIADADIIHFHHWFDFGSEQNPFKFNFLRQMKKGARHLMHWHTNPLSLGKLTGLSPEIFVKADIPQMVGAQFHESYFPDAMPVPLIVDVENVLPALGQRQKPVFLFSPSRPRHAYEDRWETKGMPEVVGLLKVAAARGVLDYRLIENMPFQECLKARDECDVVIDDIVTGSFHTTSLESLAAGKPTLSYIDSRTQLVLSELTGSTDLPIVNVRYDTAAAVIEDLARDRSLREDIGRFSRSWMEKYYSSQKMVAHYVRGYETLMNSGKICNPRYSTHARAKKWLYSNVPDLIWECRRARDCSFLRFPRDFSSVRGKIMTLLRRAKRLLIKKQ